jgi:hypothetical protein
MEDKSSSQEVHKLIELDILLDISNGLNQTQIAKKYSKSKALVSSFFKKKISKFIKKVGYGTWEITELGAELLRTRGLTSDKNPNQYFYDDVQITYDVRIKDAGMFKDGQWKLNQFTSFSLMKFGEWIVRNNNNKSITIIFPKVYGKDELEPITKVQYWARQLINEITNKYPNIEILNPIPRLNKVGSLGSTKLNELMSPITKNVTIKSNDYDIENTPKPGSFEVKVKDNPYIAASKLKDTVDFTTSGGLRDEINTLKESNRMIIMELTGLATVLSEFTKTFKNFIEKETNEMKK